MNNLCLIEKNWEMEEKSNNKSTKLNYVKTFHKQGFVPIARNVDSLMVCVSSIKGGNSRVDFIVHVNATHFGVREDVRMGKDVNLCT